MTALSKTNSGFARESGIGRSRLIDLLTGNAAWTVTEVELAGRVFGHTVASLIEVADPDGAIQSAGIDPESVVVPFPVTPQAEDEDAAAEGRDGTDEADYEA